MLEAHLATAMLVVLLAAVTTIDIRTMRIPDWLNAAIAVAGLGVTWLLERDLATALIGVVVGFALLFGANALYRSARGRDGVGMGDAKLLAGAGAWTGWMGLPFIVLIAAALGMAYVAALRLTGKSVTAAQALSFGPFLCVGIFAVWTVQTYS